MYYDDWIKESIDQIFKSIEYSEDDSLPSRRSTEVKEVHDQEQIKGVDVIPHDYSYTYLNLNSSETIILEGNETLCGLPRIPTVVMEGSHSSTIHLESDIHNGDHVTSYSSAH